MDKHVAITSDCSQLVPIPKIGLQVTHEILPLYSASNTETMMFRQRKSMHISRPLRPWFGTASGIDFTVYVHT